MSIIICFMGLACCRKLLQSTENRATTTTTTTATRMRRATPITTRTQITNLNTQIIEKFPLVELEQNLKKKIPI